MSKQRPPSPFSLTLPLSLSAPPPPLPIYPLSLPSSPQLKSFTSDRLYWGFNKLVDTHSDMHAYMLASTRQNAVWSVALCAYSDKKNDNKLLYIFLRVCLCTLLRLYHFPLGLGFKKHMNMHMSKQNHTHTHTNANVHALWKLKYTQAVPCVSLSRSVCDSWSLWQNGWFCWIYDEQR